MKIILTVDRRYKCARCNTSIKKGDQAYIETIGRMKPKRLHIECAAIWHKEGNVHIPDNLMTPAQQAVTEDADEFEEVMSQLDPHVAAYIRETSHR